MESTFFFINGKFTFAKEASISPLDLGLTRGYGVFDFLRTYQGKPFHLEDHLERLRYSASKLHLSIPHTNAEIAKIITELMQKNKFPETNIKIIVTGGESPDHIIPCGKDSFIILAYRLATYPEHYYTEGIRIITAQIDRFLPSVKSLNYIGAILALKKAKEKNAFEALYISPQNELLEATTCNFFIVKQDTLITPKEGILKGITREIVLKLAREKMPVIERAIHRKELQECDEAFLTSSNKEILPVIGIDDEIIGDGLVGTFTKTLMQLFREYTQKPLWNALAIAFGDSP